MKKILLIATGGTIASRETEHGLRPALSAGDLRAATGVKDAALERLDLLTLDSTNITPTQWERIAQGVAGRRQAHDGIIITHGTDTMAYTAAALYYMLEHIACSVVLTGAQRPLGMEGSDAEANLRLAARAALSGHSGVMIAFGGRIIHGNAAKKIHSRADDAFRSIGRAEIDLNEAPIPPSAPFHLNETLERRVAVLRLYPGMSPDAVTSCIRNGCRGIIIEGYGLGSVPTGDAEESFLPALQLAYEAGCTVVLTTQCIDGGADIRRYEVGVRAAELGVLSGGSLSIEALYALLMQRLAEQPEGRPLRSLESIAQ